ncbi:hypothetical protein D3C71_1835320 [compost metagenome]
MQLLVLLRRSSYFLSAKCRSIFLIKGFQVCGAFFNYFQGIEITFISGISPGKQPMRTEHDASDPWLFIQAFTELQTQFETRFLPGHPAYGSIKQFICNPFTIC